MFNLAHNYYQMSVSRKLNSFIQLFKQSLLGEQQDYTIGSIDRAILLLSIPMILEMSMEALFAVIDVYYVSRLHDNDSVATIGLTESMLTLIYSLAMGISMGATAMVARRVGEKDIKAAEVAAMQAIFVGVALSLSISIFGVFFSADLLRVMGANEQLIEKNSGYIQWMLTGNITIMMLFLINGIFRGAGDAFIAMRSLWLANILNIALDPIFIFGLGPIPAFGVEGAAIATNIGRGMGVLYQLYHLQKGKGLIKLHANSLMLDWGIIGRLIKVSAGGYRTIPDRFSELDFLGTHYGGFWKCCAGWLHHCYPCYCLCYSSGMGYGKRCGYVSWPESWRGSS